LSYIRPEDILAEIRRAYPVETPIERPEPPRIAVTTENLFGAVIYVYGEGVKGQYLRHGVYTRNGARYWLIEYGWVSIYGETRDGQLLPLVMLGLPTRIVYRYRPEDFISFKRELMPLGSIECREEQIINLDRVMQARDPIMIIDKYDLLRRGVPSDYADEVKELYSLIQTQYDAIAGYERAIRSLRAENAMLNSRIAKLQELLRDGEERIVKLATELTAAQTEIIRMREELRTVMSEAEVREEVSRKAMDIIDSIAGYVTKLRDLIQPIIGVREAVEREAKRAREEAKEEREEAKR